MFTVDKFSITITCKYDLLITACHNSKVTSTSIISYHLKNISIIYFINILISYIYYNNQLNTTSFLFYYFYLLFLIRK
jgi:hypothetical protein